MPLGLSWTAAHEPRGYAPPNQFVDRLSTPVLSTLLDWQHTHQFDAVDPGHTRVTDHVRTRLPRWALRAMFAFRHRQLAADLAAQRRLRAKPMTVAVTGASGLVGTALTAFLTTAGHRVIRLVRRTARSSNERQWVPGEPAADLLSGVDAVVHLAGASIAGHFSAKHEQALRDSRIGPTRALAETAARTPDGPRVFVTASAIGFYGPDRGDDRLTEDSRRGEGILADLVSDWESAASPARAAGLRVAHVRTGLVLSPRGGLLRLHYPLFAAGLGGKLGDGTQWMSWIGIDDLVDIYLRTLTDDSVSGPVNAVSPHPVRNHEYTTTLASVLHRPALLSVPALGPRLLLGRDGARELALANQCVQPHKLVRTGHEFRHPLLSQALRHLLGADSTFAHQPR
nr:TIGR01777 family oxidoreductase [Kibdelosporangium phytohabitans]